jgi:hypothetical protein
MEKGMDVSSMLGSRGDQSSAFHRQSLKTNRADLQTETTGGREIAWRAPWNGADLSRTGESNEASNHAWKKPIEAQSPFGKSTTMPHASATMIRFLHTRIRVRDLQKPVEFYQRLGYTLRDSI